MKNKFFSLINICGLAIGFACCLLIGLYIQYEFSYDKYHKNHDRIYRLATQVNGSGYQNGIAKIGAMWAPEAKLAIPEIEEFTRFKIYGQALIKQGTEQLYQNGGFFADSTVFKVFSWKLLGGNAANALSEPNSVVLTQSLSNKLFGKSDPVGKTLDINHANFKVTGVLQDPPPASHFDFSFFVSLSTSTNEDITSWTAYQYYTYLLLKRDVSPEVVLKKIKNLVAANIDTAGKGAYLPFLQSLSDIHLHSNLFREITPNSDLTTIYIFGLVAIIILVIACVNFINLTTAKAANRAKEVGVRKANGAVKSNLVKQFIIESLLVGLMAGVFAYLMSSVLIKPFGSLMGRELNLNLEQNAGLFISLFGLIILTSVVSSIYPAFILSSFRPVKVLRGNLSFKSNNTLRTGLVIFQFTLSIGLILAVLIIGKQLRYVQQKDLGFSKDQVITIPLQNDEKGTALDNIINRVRNIPGVVSISASSNQPGGNDWGLPYSAIGIDNPPSMRCLVADEDFLNTYNIKIAAGRNFSKDFVTDSTAFLINETAAKQLGWKDPLEHQLSLPAIGRSAGPIIGVVKDFHYHSLHETIEPLYVIMKKDWFTQLNIKIAESGTAGTLSSLKKLWAEVEPQFPFKYNFLDESFQAFYESEKRTSALLSWFTIVAIVISCLGLYGLSTLIVKQRIKEIGIRKILGSSVTGIVALLTKNFLKPVFIGLLIASPLAWYFMNRWLQAYAYRADINLWMFALAGLFALLIALFTVGFQAIKAAVSSPVKSLRTE